MCRIDWVWWCEDDVIVMFIDSYKSWLGLDVCEVGLWVLFCVFRYKEWNYIINVIWIFKNCMLLYVFVVLILIYYGFD